MAVVLRGCIRLQDVFGKSFRLFGRHFVAISFFSAVAVSPFYLTVLAKLSQRWGDGIVFFMGLVCPLFASGMIAYGVVRNLHGRPAGMLETLDALARRFLPMIGVGIPITLLIYLGSLVALIPLFVITSFLLMSDATFRILMLLPPEAVVFLPPAAVVLSIFFVAAPVCVAEQVGFVKSLWRSRFLTKGYRWRIFSSLLLILVPYIAVSAEAAVLAASIRAYTGTLVTDHVVQIAVSWVVETVFIAFLSVVTAVFYFEVRAAKEGISDAKIADAFE
jgi:hypothetical protein